ncbi:MAG: choice-of-anchor J domain-containing protein [Cloacibacterium sp.]|nr:choice-of-anchor J domain-containing protein [Cloacibacterium sp.]
MKKYFSIIRIFILSLMVFLTSCVQDDVYSTPDLQGKCQDLTPTKTIAEVKAAFALASTNNVTITEDIIIEGYVSSSDESGNVYKTIYLQDAPENPTQGLVVSVDAVSTYTSYPQGSKVYIKLKGLAFGKYGNLLQVGYMNLDPVTNTSEFGRIPEKLVKEHLVRSCAPKAKIVPKVITLSQLSSSIDPLIGALVQVNNAEFPVNLLCNVYAPNGTSVDRQIVDPTRNTPASSRVVRNSGYASFASDQLPSGNGTFIGILSKFNTTYQFYINRVSDLNMKGPRLDGSTPSCSFNTAGKTMKTVAEVKAYFSGTLAQIPDNAYLKAQVTANDKTGNLFKYIYVEDKTGGIRVNIDMASLYADPRFFVGKHLLINLKDLYVGAVNGEVQLGGLFNANVGRVLPNDIYKHFFPTTDFTEVVATEKTITGLADGDVGRWIKIKDLQFIDDDLGETFSGKRTLEDCSGKKIILNTSSFATFSGAQLDTGKGDVYAILTKNNTAYELWITNQLGADLDGNRCDGSTPPVFENVFLEDFSGALTNNWTAVSVTGTQVWNIQQFGNPRPCVVMNGFAGTSNVNEDWLVSKPIALSGYNTYSLSFETDGRYAGNPLEVYVTDNYTGVATTTWIKLNPTLDPDLTKFSPFVSSGKLDVSAFKNKNIVIAFKYTSTASASTTWEVDNVKIRGRK